MVHLVSVSSSCSYACVYVATMSVCTYGYFRHVYACTEACTIKLTAVGRAASNTLLARSSAGKMDCTSMGDFKHTRTEMQQMCDGCKNSPKPTPAWWFCRIATLTRGECTHTALLWFETQRKPLSARFDQPRPSRKHRRHQWRVRREPPARNSSGISMSTSSRWSVSRYSLGQFVFALQAVWNVNEPLS